MKNRIWIVLAAVLLLTGCAAKGAGGSADTVKEAVYTAPKIGDYDSADTAVVVDMNEAEKQITFLNLMLGRHYTLQYDGATKILSRYEEGMSMAQLAEGDIVDITFLKSNKRLNSIQISPDSWEESNITQFEINSMDGDFVVASGQYNISEDLVIISNGVPVEMIDLNSRDIIEIKGIGHDIHSIVVDKGHGYLRLKNDEYFIGGWIEVGQTVIRPVTEDMLLTVPEGKYEVLITNGGSGGMKEITVARDEEIELDIGDLEIEKTKTGSILFAVTPSTAQVYVDGDKADISNKVEMEYGIHQLIVRAEGYETITQYVKIGQAYASLEIELEKTETDKEKEDSEEEDIAYGTLSGNDTGTGETDKNNQSNTNKNDGKPGNSTDKNHTASGNDTGKDSNKGNGTASGNDVTDTTGNYKVKIEGPEGAEVYLDGNYIGIAPVSFKKVPGSHEITLRKDGYRTRSYTIQIDKDKKDVSWTFSDLAKESEEEN